MCSVDHHRGFQFGVIKKIARKILRTEIKELQDKITESYQNNLHDSETWSKALKTARDITEIQRREIDELNNEVKDLKYQNGILRQYYHLNEEPSEEIQTKMRIDIRCHDLERELDHQRNIADVAKMALPIFQCNQIANMQTMMGYYHPYRMW